MVAHAGFEPAIFALRGRCPGPLDECALQWNLSKLRPDYNWTTRIATNTSTIDTVFINLGKRKAADCLND